jgi:hypothetical protein
MSLSSRSKFHWGLVAALALCAARGVPQSTCSRMGEVKLNHGNYHFQMNDYNSAIEECARVTGLGFQITSASFTNPTDGAPATYTSIYRGCHWSSCTSNNPFPIQESDLSFARTGISITQPSGFNNDAAYDIWFNRSAETSGQPNGAEIMIWLNHQGVIRPFGSRVTMATIDGTQSEVWTGNQTSWKIVSYVASKPVTQMTNLNLMPFFRDALDRRSLEPAWWLIDVEFGFEIWTGGKGLSLSDFTVSAGSISHPDRDL